MALAALPRSEVRRRTLSRHGIDCREQGRIADNVESRAAPVRAGLDEQARVAIPQSVTVGVAAITIGVKSIASTASVLAGNRVTFRRSSDSILVGSNEEMACAWRFVE